MPREGTKHIYMLPKSLLIQLEEYINPDNIKIFNISIEDIYKYIEDRVIAKPLKFDIDDLKEYIEMQNELNKSKLPSPIVSQGITAGDLSTKNLIPLDNARDIDYKNKAAIFEYFRKNALIQMDKLNKEAESMSGREVFVQLQGMWFKAMEITTTILEKEEKLRSTFQQSNKFQDTVREMFDRFFIIVRGAIKKNVTDEETLTKILDDIELSLKLFKF